MKKKIFKRIIISDDFIKFKSTKEILLIKIIPKGNCEKIISNLKKNKKKYISLSQNIIPGKTKDWKRLDNLNEIKFVKDPGLEKIIQVTFGLKKLMVKKNI